MFRKRFEEFINDERGAYTLWSLMWFLLYVVIGGFAVDGTDAYRNQVMLQSTADAAALAGAMSLYVSSEDPVDAAVAYASANLDQELHGTVLTESDVVLGEWDSDTETFTKKAYDPNDESTGVNAVYVVTRKGEANDNQVVMSFLRILQGFGLDPWWNINTAAVAVRYIPDCVRKNGVAAWNRVKIGGNNTMNSMCWHAQNAVDDPGHDYSISIQNNNVIGDDVQFTQPDVGDFDGRPTVCTHNPGLCDPGVITQGTMPPFDAFVVDGTIAKFASADPAVMPSFMFHEVEVNGVSQSVGPKYQEINNAQDYNGGFEPYTVYNMQCSSPSQQMSLPNTEMIQNVVIVSNCSIKANEGVQLKNAVIASSALGNGTDPRAKSTFNFPADATIGEDGFCNDSSGQVLLLSSASMHVSAGSDVHGLRMIAGGNLSFTANGDIYGISAVAGGNVSTTSNGTWEYCEGEFEGPFEHTYRLVR